IYTGITIAEYYRDMGYNVALMADSTSRWAEALREISGRLEEMPGEEGYPAYLGRRLSEFYERSGNAIVKSNDERIGSITIVGAVSPPGGDISEPVSQNTLRVTRVFWALDASLASRRHFPSINWLNSYSLYQGDLLKWYSENIAKDWGNIYKESMGILQKESELQEVVQLVGFDALPEKEKSVLDIARMIREDFLQQSAFDDIDQYCSMGKQYGMISLILEMGRQQIVALDKGFTMTQLSSMPSRDKISRMKEVPEDKFPDFQEQLRKEIIDDVAKLTEAQ
ncbi:MAG: ATP synthase beta subunit C-terminal domain-containing protein, partial [Thermoplasmataceae archaeon]